MVCGLLRCMKYILFIMSKSDYNIQLNSVVIEPATRGDIFVTGHYDGVVDMIVNENADFVGGILLRKVEKMSLTLPRCDFCKHYHDGKGKMCCEAFPDGIPMEKMWSDEENEKCANGIKFEEE